ncbi:MAG: potassium transporter TrkG [Eubacteriales bacterium]|nr:potassium transporter TrkG [Eubacteriales bacterium]
MPLVRARKKSGPFKTWLYKLPTRIIIFSFVLIILLGSVLLMLPISSATGTWTRPFTAVFTATSASCVTGLILHDTATHWSTFGEAVILILIQVGGLGLATITSFFLSFRAGRKSWRLQALASESTALDSREELWRMVRLIVLLTLGFETVGALILITQYVPIYGRAGIWKGIFHSISAFCNAGFDLNGDGPMGAGSSLLLFKDNTLVLLTTAFLIIAGGLGFIVWFNLAYLKREKRLNFHTRVVLIVTGALLLVGTILTLLLESDNFANPDTLGNMSFGKRLVSSFFHSTSCRTAGFNSFDMGQMHESTKFVSSILMFIGAASGGTGGGIKITTFIIVMATVRASLQQSERITLMKHKLRTSLTMRAVAIIALAFSVLYGGAFLISIFDSEAIAASKFNFIDVLFETSSALGTVGLSTISTSRLSMASQAVLLIIMFLGRVGPASVALTLAGKANLQDDVLPEGKLLVG